MKTIIVTGGTGNIGTTLIPMVANKGYRVIVFTRHPELQKNQTKNISYTRWDPSSFYYDAQAIGEADAVINLAGESIANGRWTKKRMRQIYDSRINSGKTILRALEEIPNKVQVVVNASAIGYYGNGDGIHSLTEDEPSGKSFLSHVCKDWEESIKPITERGKRLVILRTGMVLDSKGGGYPKMTATLKYRFGAVVGTGREIMSWIHIEDLCRMYLYAIDNESISGIFNACAPQPVTSKEFMRQAGMAISGKEVIIFRTPPPLLRLILGKVVDEAILQNVRISGEKIIKSGFQFLYTTISRAILNLNEKN